VLDRPSQRATFVYVSSEDPRDEVARRSIKITRRLELPTSTEGLYWDRRGKKNAVAILDETSGLELTPFFDEMHERLSAIQGHKFVVLDSCYDFVQFKGHSKISEDAVNAFIKRCLQRLCDETDSNFLVLWHPSQAGQERGDASGWSVAWHNAPRARLSIKKDSAGTYTLKVEKRNNGPDGEVITLHWADGTLLPTSSLQMQEQRTKGYQACVDLAIECAKAGVPLQGQRHLKIWQLDKIGEVTGVRPDHKLVKELLSKAVYKGDLAYIRGSQHKAAGYYPPNNAEDAARAAKAQQKERKSVEARAAKARQTEKKAELRR
jgi:hypothetical protein